MSRALGLLKIRPRSEAELKARLQMAGFKQDAREQVMSILKEKGLVNDMEFAKTWVESRQRVSPRGRITLIRELRAKKVSAPLIEKAIAENPVDETAAIEKTALKKLPSLRKMPANLKRKKLFEHLARKGFDFEKIKDTIEKIIYES